MCAQDEASLQEQLFGRALDGAPSLGVLVLQPKAQELRRLELNVRRQCPLPAALDGQLGPVSAQAGGPATIDVVLGVRVCAPALGARVAAGVAVHFPEAAQPLGGQREDRKSGARPDPLVLAAHSDHGVSVAVGGGAGGRRQVELQPAELLELEERTPAADEQRIAQRAAAEGRLVVAVEDAE